jgi:hypothetical protein
MRKTWRYRRCVRARLIRAFGSSLLAKGIKLIEEKSKAEAYDERILQWAITFFVGLVLWLLIYYWLRLSSAAEAFLVAGLVAAHLVYLIPPRPLGGYLRWLVESFLIVIGFYLALWKVPIFLQRWIAYPVAFGLSLFICFAIASLALRRPGKRFNIGDLVTWGFFALACFELGASLAEH